MKFKSMVFLAIFVFFGFNAFADTLLLKSGKEIEGAIVEKTGDSVKISAYGAELVYFIDEIDKINGEQIAVFQSTPAKVVENAGEKAQDDLKPVQPEPDNKLEKDEPAKFPLIGSEKSKSNSSAKFFPTGKFSKSDAMAVAGIMAGIGILILIFSLITYIFGSICLMIIAQKTSTEPAWLAWVPIGNLFLMCKIGSVSYYWLFGLLLAFVPFVGGLLVTILFGYLWFKVALARNKPGWIGILTCIPLLGLFVMGYLAFSE